MRGARLGNAERVDPSLAELNRALHEAGKNSVWPYFVVTGALALLIMFVLATAFGR